MNETLDLPETAVAVREPQDLLPAPRADAQTNRIAEVNEALLPAYQKASELKLTDAEAKALREVFPDEEIEIRPFDGLIYLPHITISDRLTDVLGPGQWSMVRRREWVEGDRIYGEFVMKIRGCFIGESVGAMEYHPANAKMNYADALEGTRGEAVRRIAGKDLGCGSQVWKPSFCRNWVEQYAAKVWCSDDKGKKRPMWRRKTAPPIDLWPWKEDGGQRAPINVARNATPAPKPAPVEADPVQDKLDHETLLKAAYKLIPEPMRLDVAKYLTDFPGKEGKRLHWLLPTEGIDDLPVDKLRYLVNNWDEFVPRIDHWLRDNDQVPGAEAAEEPPQEEFEIKRNPNEPEGWRTMIIPFGKDAGKQFGDLPKNTLWWWSCVWKAEGRNHKGKWYEPSEKDLALRAKLDEVKAFYEFTEAKEKS